jgi:hypothetical protein
MWSGAFSDDKVCFFIAVVLRSPDGTESRDAVFELEQNFCEELGCSARHGGVGCIVG